MIQFDGKFRYFLRDNWNMIGVLDIFISLFVDSLYNGNESITIGIIIIINIMIIIIVNLFE